MPFCPVENLINAAGNHFIRLALKFGFQLGHMWLRHALLLKWKCRRWLLGWLRHSDLTGWGWIFLDLINNLLPQHGRNTHLSVQRLDMGNFAGGLPFCHIRDQKRDRSWSYISKCDSAMQDGPFFKFNILAMNLWGKVINIFQIGSFTIGSEIPLFERHCSKHRNSHAALTNGSFRLCVYVEMFIIWLYANLHSRCCGIHYATWLEITVSVAPLKPKTKQKLPRSTSYNLLFFFFFCPSANPASFVLLFYFCCIRAKTAKKTH